MDEFLQINGRTPFTKIGGFDHFRSSIESCMFIGSRNLPGPTAHPGPCIVSGHDRKQPFGVVHPVAVAWRSVCRPCVQLRLFEGRSRDERLQGLYVGYMHWCKISGVPQSMRARSILFLSKTLVSPGNYPSIGQKKLSGAAARVIIYFLKGIADIVCRLEPTDIHRTVEKAFHDRRV